MIGNCFASAVDREETDLGVALIVVTKEDAAIVGSPLWVLDIAVEFIGERMRIAAVAIHQIKLGRLVALIAIIVAGVSDEFSVGRDNWRIVGAFAIGKGTKGAVCDAEFVDFAVKVFVIGFGMAIDGNDQILGIGCPGRTAGTEFVATVREIAVGDLAWCAAFAVNDEDLHVAGFEIARPIETINQTIVGGGRIGPFCAGRRGRKIGDVGAFGRNESGEREHFPIGRPGDGVGRLFEIGDARGLAGVHPADVKLLFAIGIGEVSKTQAVRRPAWRNVAAVAGGERAMVGSVGVDDPEIRIALVGHGIGEAAHVGDFLSVGRDLRIGGKLQLELVHGGEFVRSILRPESGD